MELDIRKHQNARWIDQKCTPDNLSLIANCIVKGEFFGKEFTSKELWLHPNTNVLVESFLKKPNVNNPKAKNEYDKFFQQNLKMLSHSCVLEETKTHPIKFKVLKQDKIIELSLGPFKACEFISEYAEKTLRASGLGVLLDDFLNFQTPESYINLKIGFENLLIQNTPINKVTEPRRIFTKVINPISYKYNKLGSFRGRISKDIIIFTSLFYDNKNFRDKDKPKSKTRFQHAKNMAFKDSQYSFTELLESKAKKNIKILCKEYNQGVSFVTTKGYCNDNAPATQAHHIFLKSQKPNLKHFTENLIALTPNQHFQKAHPNNNTSTFCPAYRESLLKTQYWLVGMYPNFYSKEKFVKVLNEGLNTNRFSIKDTKKQFKAKLKQLNTIAQ